MSKPPYANIFAELLWHPKLLALPEEDRLAGLGFFAAVCAVCQLYRNDGYVRGEQLRSVMACPDDQRERTTRVLIDVGLFDEVPGGIQVHDFLDHNRSREQIENCHTRKAEGGRNSGRSRRNISSEHIFGTSTEKSREEQRQGEKSQDETRLDPGVVPCPVCVGSDETEGESCPNCWGSMVVSG